MAISRVGTETITNSSANAGDHSYSHTTTSDTDLLLLTVFLEGSEVITTTPTFDGDDFTLIRDTGDTGNNADVRVFVYEFRSPAAKTATIFVDFTGNVNPSASIAVNYSGAGSAKFLSEDINTTASSTGVHASGGASTSALFVVGCGQGNDMQPASVDNSFVEVWDQQTGTSAAADFGHIGAELLTGAPSGVTITYGSPTSDQNTSVLIELLVPDTSLEDWWREWSEPQWPPIDTRFASALAASSGQAPIDPEALNLPAAPTVTDVETDEDYDDKDTAVTITGIDFESSQGTGIVEMGDDSDHAMATRVAQTVTSWSDTAIDFTADLGAQSPGDKWIFVTTDSGLKNDPGFAVTVHRAQAFKMSASANISASGEATTVQLTAPSGKTTGDFDAGRIQDDENPADTVDITLDDYTEMEWSIEGTTNARDVQYDFRVTDSGTVIDTYTVTPQLTISTAVAADDEDAGLFSPGQHQPVIEPGYMVPY